MKTAITMMSVNRRFKEGKIDIRGFIELCGRLGVTGVDLVEYYWKDKPNEIKAVPGWLADNNLELSVFAIGNNFAGKNPEKMQEQVDYVRSGIDTAVALGAKTLRIFGGQLLLKEQTELEHGMEATMDGISRCLAHAQANRVVLALENHGGLPGRSDQVLRILNRFDSEYLKSTIDIGNFIANSMIEKEDPVSGTRALVKHAAHCHVKDFGDDPDEPGKVRACVLGEGKVPVKKCLQALKSGGYRGFLSLEYECRFIDELEGMNMSVKNMNAILNEI